MARPQRRGGDGGGAADGKRAVIRTGTRGIPAAANDNGFDLKRRMLRLLPWVAALGLVLSLLRHALG